MRAFDPLVTMRLRHGVIAVAQAFKPEVSPSVRTRYANPAPRSVQVPWRGTGLLRPQLLPYVESRATANQRRRHGPVLHAQYNSRHNRCNARNLRYFSNENCLCARHSSSLISSAHWPRNISCFHARDFFDSRRAYFAEFHVPQTIQLGLGNLFVARLD